MRKIKPLLISILLFALYFAGAQVSIDHPIQLTGSGTNAKLSGIQNVSSSNDAVNADYVQRDSLKFAIATGSNNAYNVNLAPQITNHYTVGMVVLFQANFANTGPATLNVNSLGPDTIMKNYNSYLAANDILGGQMVAVIFDGAYFQMLSPVSNTPASGGYAMQIFSSSGTFTVPAGVTNIVIEVWGAGGGGSGNSGNNVNCPGGGGGGYGKQSFPVTPGTVLTVTVGAGGMAGPANGTTSTGGTGGTSSVSGTGVSISATGGAGGSRNSNVGGTGGSSTAALNFSGLPGGATDTGSSFGGNAGGPGGGPGGVLSTSNTNGVTGTFPGGGASGAVEGNSTTVSGGTGTGGAVFIYY